MARKDKPKAAPSQSAEPAAPPLLLYKVVELSNVDESAMEETVNTWVQKGWAFDGVQFAMRESSKRPSMAFVFFTRPGTPEDEQRARDADDAHRTLRRLAAEPVAEQQQQQPAVSAWDRLAQLAGEDDDD